MRISDWSSDVCSSDLPQPQLAVRQDRMLEFELRDLLQRQFDAELLLRQTHRPAELQHARQHRRAGKVIGKTGQLRRHRETDANRSEEHTSELQSLMRISYAVFCLKKKKTNKQKT